MATASDMANEVRNAQNSSFSAGMDSCLLANGFTAGEISSINNIYSNIINNTTDLTELTSISQSNLDSIDSSMTNLVKSTEESKQASKNLDNNNGLTSNYSVQDAIVAKTFPEKEAIIKSNSSIPSFPPASSSLSDEYPQTQGKIDISGNWYKVNKTTKYVEFVHNSGSSLKIDKFGNTAVHITGGFKFIIDEDVIVNILGNLDYGVVENALYQVLGDLDTKVGNNFKITASSIIKMLSSKIGLN